MVHDLSLAPCADCKILATTYFDRIRLRMKNSTRWLVLELATAGARQGRSVAGDKDPPTSCEIIKDLETVCCSLADIGELHDPIKYRQRAQQFESVLSSS